MDDTCRLTNMLKASWSMLKEPLLFKNMLRKSDGSFEWKLLQWDICDFANVFGDTQLPFRVGDHNKRTCATQHSQRSVESPAESDIPLTFLEFINKVKYELNDNKWIYCDYKHMLDLIDKLELIKSFNWLRFGIDEDVAQDGLYSTIWIGSRGAHTDCHWDTYGYNLVAQVYGRKLWLLYPPSDALLPVRVPYEESTVYSNFNFYCPTKDECCLLENIPVKPKLIVLEAGDVLFVPNGWWHYVESLDPINISVNIWGKLETDHRARVKEALVQLLVAKLANVKLEESNVSMDDNYHHMKIVENAVIEYKKKKNQTREREERVLGRKKRKEDKSNWTAEDLAEMYPTYVKLLKDAERHEFKEFLQERRERDSKIKETETQKENDVPQFDSFLENLVNSLCHPNIINKAADMLLERCSE